MRTSAELMEPVLGRRGNRLDFRSHVSDRLPASFRLLLEATTKQIAKARSHCGRQRVQIRVADDDGREHVGERVAVERPPSRQHFVEHDPE